MEKEYKSIVLFFIAIAIIVFIGFFPTYFIHFPKFEGFLSLHHFHAIVMISWLLMLIIQPILISKRKYQWHRLIGQISYFLVPIIIISMLLVYKRAFINSLDTNGINNIESLCLLFLPLTDVLPFTVFYLLAIKNKKETPNHFRYMISTAIVIVGAGFVRILTVWFDMDFISGLYVNGGVLTLVFVGLILYDLKYNKLSNNKSFVIAFFVFVIPNFLLLFVPNTAWWQSLTNEIAKAFI